MTHNIKGYCYAIGYSIITAISMMSIHHISKKISPLISTGIIFTIAIIFFNLMNRKQLCSTYKTIFAYKKPFFFINLFTAANWLTTFFAMLYFNPLLFITIFMATLPIATCTVGYFWKKKSIYKTHIITGIAIIFLISSLVMVGLAPEESVLSSSFLLALLLTVTSAFSAAFYLYQSKEIQADYSFSTVQVLSIRFHLLVLLCAIALLVLPGQAFYFPTFSDWLHLIGLALFSSILPLFFMQQGIALLGSMKMSFLIPSTLVFTYVFLYLEGIKMHVATPFIISSLAMLLGFYPYFERRAIAKCNPLNSIAAK